MWSRRKNSIQRQVLEFYGLFWGHVPRPAADPWRPSCDDLTQVLGQIITRVTRYLERQGVIVKDGEQQNFQIPIHDEDTFTRLLASSVTYKFTTGPRKGQKAIVLRSVSDEDHNSQSGLVVKNSGFSLHAGVATKAQERDKLERIARYIARPAIAEERLSTNSAGDVIYRFKKPWAAACEAVQHSHAAAMTGLPR